MGSYRSDLAERQAGSHIVRVTEVQRCINSFRPSSGGRALEASAQAESVGLLAHRGDAKGDVLIERDAEFFSAFHNVLATHTAGESLIFHALSHGANFEIENALRRTNIGAGCEKTGEFVTSEKRVLERSLPRDAGVIGVRENGADEFFAVAVFAKDFGAFGGVFAVGRVVVVGPAFVVEIVQESGEAPEIFIGAVFAGVGADTGFDGEHVFL